jgi:hypothetical protein
MIKILCLSMMLISLSMSGQAIPKAPSIPPKIYSGKPIVIPGPSKANPVLVIYNNTRLFAKNVQTVTDTLPASRYQILTSPDSIRRYTDSEFVSQVILISNP